MINGQNILKPTEIRVFSLRYPCAKKA